MGEFSRSGARTYGIDVDAKGARQNAIEKLAKGEGAWARALARVDDAPTQWRVVCDQLRAAEPPQRGFFDEPKAGTSTDNVLQEKLLAGELVKAADLPPIEAISRVIALEDNIGRVGRRVGPDWAKRPLRKPWSRSPGSPQASVTRFRVATSMEWLKPMPMTPSRSIWRCWMRSPPEIALLSAPLPARFICHGSTT